MQIRVSVPNRAEDLTVDVPEDSPISSWLPILVDRAGLRADREWQVRLASGEPMEVSQSLAKAGIEPDAAIALVDLSPTYVGFWRRLVAAALDGALPTIALVIIVYRGGHHMGVAFYDQNWGYQNWGWREHFVWALLLVAAGPAWLALVSWFYHAGMESSAWQGTIGKRILGVIVTDAEGQRLDFWHATRRHLAKYISAAVFGVGFLMAALSNKKQALHDRLAATLVLRRK